MGWKRLNYLVHRWVGIVLGVLMLTWFVSGIAMMYYPYPELTVREQLAAMDALPRDSALQLIGFARARAVAEQQLGHAAVAGRLLMTAGRPVYRLTTSGRRFGAGVLVDAVSASPLAHLSRENAERVAAGVAPPGATPQGAAVLSRGDHYVMGTERASAFPAWKVDFSDAGRTAVYVSVATGEPFAHVDRRTRLTTWIGTVPHWLYFQWLYADLDTWIAVNIVLPAVACLIALTGMVIGFRQLFPRRRRGQWRASGYHGVSQWHHLAGLVFGALVFTWTLSGVLEVLGPSSSPSAVQLAAARSGALPWAMPLGEGEALRRARTAQPGATWVAVDVERSGARAGYVVLSREGQRVWVDGTTGAVEASIDAAAARRVAERVAGSPAATRVDWLEAPDAYYYAPHDRERALPVWRVRVDDAARHVVYVDPVTGLPAAVVNASVRRWRWWREGLHDLDIPALNNRRPLWDVVVLPLMLGGVVSALTGVWLLVRRVSRLSRTGTRAA